MTTASPARAWEALGELLAAGAGDAAVGALLDALPPGEAARTMSRLEAGEQRRVFELLDPADAAQLIEQMADVQAAEMLDDLAPGVAAAILHELESAEQADLLASLTPAEAEAILAELPPAEAAAVRQLSDYPPDVAGGLMVTELLAYPQSFTVAEVADDLRKNAETYADYAVQYVYATDRRRRLSGVLQIRDFLLGRPGTCLAEIMITEPLAVAAEADLEELEDVFQRYGFLAIPVVDARRRLLGVVRRSAVQEALADRADSDYRKALGIVGGEELRTMPLLRRSARRLREPPTRRAKRSARPVFHVHSREVKEALWGELEAFLEVYRFAADALKAGRMEAPPLRGCTTCGFLVLPGLLPTRPAGTHAGSSGPQSRATSVV